MAKQKLKGEMVKNCSEERSDDKTGRGVNRINADRLKLEGDQSIRLIIRNLEGCGLRRGRRGVAVAYD